MYTLKVDLNNELRRVSVVSEDPRGRLRFTQVYTSIKNLFPALKGIDFKITWEDEEKDMITCSSDQELDDAIGSMIGRNMQTLRFHVSTFEENKSKNISDSKNSIKSTAVHSMVTCDECHMHPIVGIRYKCTIRHDYDLCEGCEAKREQPYPMIKIYDPVQAPASIVVTLNDDQYDALPPSDRFTGSWKSRCGAHRFRSTPWLGPGVSREDDDFRGSDHPHTESFQQGAHEQPLGCDNQDQSRPSSWFENFGPGRRFHKKCDRWDRKFQKWQNKMDSNHAWRRGCGPFTTAMDSFVKSFQNVMGDKSSANVQTTEEENVRFDEQMVEDAIRCSLMETETSASAPSNLPEQQQQQQTGKVPGYVDTTNPAVKTLPKPALRFVRDVTFPDGTLVHPGSIFRKVWRVRNDGLYSWPEGVLLVFAGGDLLTDPNEKISVEVLEAGKEADISIQMKAPECPGRFVSYFRMQTKEEQNFGQRLWADIVVVEEESEWHLVRESGLVRSDPDNNLEPVVPDDSMNSTMQSIVDHVLDSVQPQMQADGTQPNLRDYTPVEESTSSNVVKWRKELQLLSEMGFTNTDELVSLLELQLVKPSNDTDSSLHSEGIQRVVATLLSRSGFLN